MATQYIGAGTVLANEAITAFRMVTISNNRGVGLSATGTRPDGVAQNDAASGDLVTVKFMTGPGTQKGALVAGPITVGDTVFAGASGQVALSGTVTVGKILTTSTTAAIVEFIPKNF